MVSKASNLRKYIREFFRRSRRIRKMRMKSLVIPAPHLVKWDHSRRYQRSGGF